MRTGPEAFVSNLDETVLVTYVADVDDERAPPGHAQLLERFLDGRCEFVGSGASLGRQCLALLGEHSQGLVAAFSSMLKICFQITSPGLGMRELLCQVEHIVHRRTVLAQQALKRLEPFTSDLQPLRVCGQTTGVVAQPRPHVLDPEQSLLQFVSPRLQLRVCGCQFEHFASGVAELIEYRGGSLVQGITQLCGPFR